MLLGLFGLFSGKIRAYLFLRDQVDRAAVLAGRISSIRVIHVAGHGSVGLQVRPAVVNHGNPAWNVKLDKPPISSYAIRSNPTERPGRS